MQRIAIALFSIALIALACGAPTPPPTPPANLGTPPPLSRPEDGAPLSATAVTLPLEERPPSSEFAPFTPNQVEAGSSATDFTPDSAALQNPEALAGLPLSQQEHLVDTGFLIIPQAYDHPLAIYGQAGANGQPIYITTDLLFYSAHSLLSFITQETERNYLSPDLLALSSALLATTEEQLNNMDDEDLEQAALANLAFFSVGTGLQNPDIAFLTEVSGRVTDELTLIRNAEGQYRSPIRDTVVDYSLYSPTGAALIDPQISDYRQAINWYAHASLLVGDPDPSRSRPAARQLLLLLQALEQSENLSRWDRIHVTQSYFMGQDQSPSVAQAQALATAVFGDIPDPADLVKRELLDSFIATWQATWGDQPFRFMPLATRPDNPIFPALVYDQVGLFMGNSSSPPPTALDSNIGLIRGLPTGWDVSNALGSDRARDFLFQRGDSAYDGYDTQLATLRANYMARDQSGWTQTQPESHLYTLQSLVGNERLGLPFYMNQPAWNQRLLNSWYGGWAMTRHEVVWRSRPVSTSPIPTPGGFVEPAPVFFARLAAAVRQFMAGLDGRGLLDKGHGEQLLQLARLLDELQYMSQQELAGTPLTENEQATIGRIGDTLARLLSAPGPTGNLSPPPLPFVVNVYQNPQNDHILQAAIGEVWPLYVIVPGIDGPILTQGAVYSTYEFGRPAGAEWTNAEWQNLQDRSQYPSQTVGDSP